MRGRQLKDRGGAPRILITGISGMLGVYLVERLRGDFHVVGLDVKEFPEVSFALPGVERADITRADEVKRTLSELAPRTVIHAAAYTDVDGCENHPEKAYQVNALGTQSVCRACKELGIPLMYISTDFVFDGRKKLPYVESDRPAPVSTYGKSKLAGEEYCRGLLKRYFLVRTSWLYGGYGKNFVDTILGLAANRDELTVVNDQVGSPTYAKDLADVLAGILARGEYGVYHASNSGSCSWLEFAREILRLASAQGIRLRAIASRQLDRPAPRPEYSVLAKRRIRQVLGVNPRHWKEALKEYMGSKKRVVREVQVSHAS